MDLGVNVAVPNPRIKLTACGTLTHGTKGRRSHAAAYPHRYAGNKKMCTGPWLQTAKAGPDGPAPGWEVV